MKVTDAFLGEHGVFYAQFDHLERAVPEATTPAQVRAHAAFLAAALASHARLEDELLFTALEPRLGAQGGPLAMMRTEHDEIEGGLSRLPGLEGLAEAQDLLLHVVRVARGHFAKEEQVLYPMAEQVLGAGTLGHLGADWARQRKVVVGG